MGWEALADDRQRLAEVFQPGATRNDPLDPKLIGAMSFLGDMGITMDVISGGQEAAGEGGARTGSVRHDHGGAGDVDFYKDGRKLDWNNPADMPILVRSFRRPRPTA